MLRDDRTDGGGRRPASRNVLGEPLELCSIMPTTGFYRDGCCNTGRDDFGSHTVCVVLTSAFLEFSKSRGNDLSTAMPEFGFPGLKPGDQCCYCAPRWQEALEAKKDPAWSCAPLMRLLRLTALPDNPKQRDLTPRQRKPLKEFVFTGKWGNPAPFLAKR
jgi:uncharacterized protein